MKLSLITVGLFACLSANAYTLSLNFNDGTAGDTLNGFYSGEQATFQNAKWYSVAGLGITPHPDSNGLGFSGLEASLQPKVGSPIIVSFDQAMRSISVIANSVNANGARMDAYDAVSGGSLVTFDQVVGPSSSLNSNFTLEILGSGIRRIELYQPLSVESEGVLFDNLNASTVPEPNMFGLVLGIGFLTLARRKRSV